MMSESIEETYDWAKKVRGEWEAKIAAGEDGIETLDKELSGGGDHKLDPVAFARTERPSYLGEVGKVDGDLFFHFFPSDDDKYSVLTYAGNRRDQFEKEADTDNWVRVFPDVFADALATSFIEVFKFEDKMCWDFVPEMNSWVVRVTGMADNPHADDLSMKLFNVLQGRLEK